MKKKLLALLMALGMAVGAQAQVTIPNTLVTGSIIRAGDLNTNFSTLGTHALDRTGGNISGNITVDGGITIDGIDIGNTICVSCSPTLKNLTLSSPTTGITVNGVNIVNLNGKIPALTTTYFAALDVAALTGTLPALNGSALTSLTASNLTGSLPAISGASLTSLNGSNISSGTIAVARGGTGTGSTPSNGQLLIGNGATYTLATITAGTGISVTNGAGTITVTGTGVKNYTVTPANVSNTAVENTSLSFTVPANDMADGDVLDVSFSVKFNAAAPTTTYTPRWYFGTPSVSFGAIAIGNSGIETQFVLKAYMIRVGNDVWVLKSGGNGANPFGVLGFYDLNNSANENKLIISAPTFSGSSLVKLTIQFDAAAANSYFNTQGARAIKIS